MTSSPEHKNADTELRASTASRLRCANGHEVATLVRWLDEDPRS